MSFLQNMMGGNSSQQTNSAPATGNQPAQGAQNGGQQGQSLNGNGQQQDLNPNPANPSANDPNNNQNQSQPSLTDPDNFDIEAFMAGGNTDGDNQQQPNNGQFPPELANFVKGLQNLDNNQQDQPATFDAWYQENMPSFDPEQTTPFDSLFEDGMGNTNDEAKKGFMEMLNTHNKQMAEKMFTNTATMAKNLIEKTLNEKFSDFKGEMTQNRAVNQMNEAMPFTADVKHRMVANQILEQSLRMAKGNVAGALGMVKGYYTSTNPSVFENGNNGNVNDPMNQGYNGANLMSADSVADLFKRG